MMSMTPTPRKRTLIEKITGKNLPTVKPATKRARQLGRALWLDYRKTERKAGRFLKTWGELDPATKKTIIDAAMNGKTLAPGKEG